MKIEEKFEHILKNSIHIQDPDYPNTISWFYPSESEFRHKKLCEVLNREYKVNLDNDSIYTREVGTTLKNKGNHNKELIPRLCKCSWNNT